MLLKERLFEKKLIIANYREFPFSSTTSSVVDLTSGKTAKLTTSILAEIYYSPKGYICEINMTSPIYAVDPVQVYKIHGISDESPEGDLHEKNFWTLLAAMHFITRRLKKLGWKAVGDWRSSRRLSAS